VDARRGAVVVRRFALPRAAAPRRRRHDPHLATRREALLAGVGAYLGRGRGSRRCWGHRRPQATARPHPTATPGGPPQLRPNPEERYAEISRIEESESFPETWRWTWSGSFPNTGPAERPAARVERRLSERTAGLVSDLL